jgi:pimeloyl-ACP methyl ester carboxylesterase
MTLICTAHPAALFDEGTASLLSDLSERPVVVVNPTLGTTLDAMVDELEAERVRRGERWWFWGMSGGGWLAQLYAHRYPEALAGLIIESACPCFRARLADPACLISPHHPAWKEKLGALYAEDAHEEPYPDTAWTEVAGIGEVFRKKNGPALLISPGPQTAEMRQGMHELYRFDARPWLASLELPVLVIAGTQDPIVPVEHVRRVHQLIAGSSFIEVEGAGHVPAAEKRPEVAAAVRAMLAAAGA